VLDKPCSATRQTTEDSDQGPWGGRREICWKSEKGKRFTPSEIIDFASKNGWQLTDSLSYMSGSLMPLTNTTTLTIHLIF
jgi:hypothetical protein